MHKDAQGCGERLVANAKLAADDFREDAMHGAQAATWRAPHGFDTALAGNDIPSGPFACPSRRDLDALGEEVEHEDP